MRSVDSISMRWNYPCQLGQWAAALVKWEDFCSDPRLIIGIGANTHRQLRGARTHCQLRGSRICGWLLCPSYTCLPTRSTSLVSFENKTSSGKLGRCSSWLRRKSFKKNPGKIPTWLGPPHPLFGNISHFL